MRRRFVLARFWCVGVIASLSPASALTSSGAASDMDRVLLRCTGTMITSGESEARQLIVADGLLDLAGMRVSGFGVGSHPIVYLTAARVTFGMASGGDGVEGSIDRLTGATRISVRSPGNPAEEAISISLDCRMDRSVS